MVGTFDIANEAKLPAAFPAIVLVATTSLALWDWQTAKPADWQ